jgi:lipopolysaccharide/colanic/teichoic acid biosynthesis glycosyltransferase
MGSMAYERGLRTVLGQIDAVRQLPHHRLKKPPKLRAWKRGIDLTFATVLLVFFAPLMILIALFIKFKGSPVLIEERCIGADDLPFRRWQFCVSGAEAGIDRLPHLINILNGTMSFVGPRPVIEGERLDSRCQAYLACRPGITGLWNIVSFDYGNRDIDEQYVDECSSWFDFAIMIKTLVLIGE